MPRSALAAGVRYLHSIVVSQRYCEESDEQLLNAFANERDESAFAALVRRHGPMVLHVCRRVLGHEQDAEDAFQATFLVLARNANALRKKTALASFLHGIAYRLALNVKRTAARRRKYEGSLGALTQPRSPGNPADELSWREVRIFLDEEIARLPEKYRSVFVLCILEHLSRAEAAERLGLTERTVLNRLATARQRLARRLARRGVELTALLAAAALAEGPVSALSIVPRMGLGRATISPAVTALAESISPLGGVGKAKVLAVVLLAVSLVSGAAAWFIESPLAKEPSERRGESPPVEANTGGLTPRRSPDKGDLLTVKGRVLDPDGNPLAGARLYSVRVPKRWPRNDAAVTLAQPQPTGPEGRFHLTTNRAGHEEYVYLVAYAAGFGVDWIDLSEKAGQLEATLRLPKDVPITGRVVNTEGRPIACVSVSIAQIVVPPNDKLDDYLAAWLNNFRQNLSSAQKWISAPLDGILGKATTDKDGRFTLRGAGGERLVHVSFSGAGVARTTPWIITRPGFGPKPYNAVLLKPGNEHLRIHNRFLGLFAPDFTFIAETGKTIAGVVKDAATGKPLAGCRLTAQTSYAHGVAVVTDAEGNYSMEGLAKRARGNFLSVNPPPGTTYLGQSRTVDDTVGLATIRVDFELAKGVIVTGRVVDRQTGKPVRCYVRAAALPGNKFYGSQPGFDRSDADEAPEMDKDGRFRLVTIPGKAMLMARVIQSEEKIGGEPVIAYRRAFPDPAHRQLFTRSGESWYFLTAFGTLEFFDVENAVKVIEIEKNSETRVELAVDRGMTARIVVQDAECKPLAGAWVAGLTDSWPTAYRLPEATATVYGLSPRNAPTKGLPAPGFSRWIAELVLDTDRPRTLVFFHAGKKLGGTATIRGDEKGPIVVKLAPVGHVTGRLLDTDGNPLEGMEVPILLQSKTGSELYRVANPVGKPIRTDKEGRFHLDGIVPGMQFQLNVQKGRTFFDGEPRIGVRQVKAGETLNLGDVRIKPRR